MVQLVTCPYGTCRRLRHHSGLHGAALGEQEDDAIDKNGKLTLCGGRALRALVFEVLNDVLAE